MGGRVKGKREGETDKQTDTSGDEAGARGRNNQIKKTHLQKKLVTSISSDTSFVDSHHVVMTTVQALLGVGYETLQLNLLSSIYCLDFMWEESHTCINNLLIHLCQLLSLTILRMHTSKLRHYFDVRRYY